MILKPSNLPPNLCAMNVALQSICSRIVINKERMHAIHEYNQLNGNQFSTTTIEMKEPNLAPTPNLELGSKLITTLILHVLVLVFHMQMLPNPTLMLKAIGLMHQFMHLIIINVCRLGTGMMT
jgi:hypothetical protein